MTILNGQLERPGFLRYFSAPRQRLKVEMVYYHWFLIFLGDYLKNDLIY